MLDFTCVYEGIPEFGDCYGWLRFAAKNTNHIQIGYTISISELRWKKPPTHGLTVIPSANASAFCRASNVKNSLTLSVFASVTCNTSRLRQPMVGP